MSINLMILVVAVVVVALGGVMAAAKFIFPQRRQVNEAEHGAPKTTAVIALILGLVVMMVLGIVLLMFIGDG